MEKSILKDGCTDSIITWNGYIIDGHNRYEHCSRNNVHFKVMEAPAIKDELEVKMWIIKRQFGRRNLTVFQKAELALKLEEVESERALRRKRNGLPTAKHHSPDLGYATETKIKQEEKGKALEIAAKKAGVGAETVRKVTKILEQADDELKEDVKPNKVSIDKFFIAFK